MTDLRDGIDVYGMLNELIERHEELPLQVQSQLDYLRTQPIGPAQFAWIRLRHGELPKGVNDMARKPKNDEGGTALADNSEKKPGEQLDLVEVDSKYAKKFKALAEEVASARRSKKKANDKEKEALEAIRELSRNCDVEPNPDGSMHILADDLDILVTPSAEAVIIKPISRTPTPSKRGKGESPD